MSPLPFILMTALFSGDPAASEGTVLNFSATWCGPCQQMSPMVSRLARQGYPIQKIDVDKYREYSQQFQIEKMPTFVLVVKGKEVSRHVGMISEETLMEMFARIPKKSPEPVPARTVAVNTGNTLRAKLANEEVAPPNAADLSPTMAASTRIRIRDKSGENFGSGTIIDSRAGNTIVLTCGHIFRDLDSSSVIEVDVFSTGKPVTYVGKLIKFDIESEVGLISIAPDFPLPVCKVARAGYQLRVDQPVESIGCGSGAPPKSYNIKITALNLYLGADNIECNGVPKQGRSGGGLFTQDGQVIGICMAADEKKNRGLYSSLKPIQDMLDKCQLTRLYRPETDGAATRSITAKAASEDVEEEFSADDLEIDLAALRDARPADSGTPIASSGSGRAVASLVSGRSVETSEVSTGEADPSEVVCVIRPIKNPRGASKVVVINRASSKFMNYLTDEMKAQDEVKPTVYPVRTASAANQPSARATTGAYRRSRSLAW